LKKRSSESFQTTFLYYNIGIFKIGIGKYHQLIQFPPKRNPAASQLEFNKNCFYLPSKLI